MRTAAFLLALPLSILPAGETLEYAVAASERIQVTYTQEAELSLSDQEVLITVDGEEHPAGEQPDVGVTLMMTETTVFIDTIESVSDDAAPTKLTREFVSLTGGYDQEISGLPDEVDPPEPVELMSDLEGQKAIFQWDSGESEWTASASEDAEYEEELLEELEQNADLSFLIAKEEIAIDDSWDLEGEEFRRLLNLSGDLSMKPVDGDDDEEDELEPEWNAELFRLTLVSTAEDSATIKLEFEVARNEEGEVEPGPMPEGMEMEPPTITETEEILWTGTGELVWSLTEKRAISVEMSGSLGRDFESNQEMDAPMGTVIINQKQTFEGTFSVSIAFEAAASEE